MTVPVASRIGKDGSTRQLPTVLGAELDDEMR
jgi:hypothetical protein